MNENMKKMMFDEKKTKKVLSVMKKFVPLHSQNRTTPVSLREISQRLAHSSIG